MTSIAAFTLHGPLGMNNTQLDDFVDHFEEVIKDGMSTRVTTSGKVKCESDFIKGDFGFTVTFNGISIEEVINVIEHVVHNLDRKRWEVSLVSPGHLKVWKCI